MHVCDYACVRVHAQNKKQKKNVEITIAVANTKI